MQLKDEFFTIEDYYEAFPKEDPDGIKAAIDDLLTIHTYPVKDVNDIMIQRLCLFHNLLEAVIKSRHIHLKESMSSPLHNFLIKKYEETSAQDFSEKDYRNFLRDCAKHIPDEKIQNLKKADELRNYFGEKSKMDRVNLFYLMLYLKCSREETQELFYQIHYRYVSMSNPHDLLFDFCLSFHLSIASALQLDQYVTKIEDALLQSLENEHFHYQEIVNTKSETYTHMINEDYLDLLQECKDIVNGKEEDYIACFKEFLQDQFDVENHFQQNRFHYMSHYLLKTIYHLVSSENPYYNRRYIHVRNTHSTYLFEQLKDMKFNTLIEDIYYIASRLSEQDKDLKDYICDVIHEKNEAELPLSAFLRQCIKKSLFGNETADNGRFFSEFTLQREINRSLFLFIVFLTGHVTIEDINRQLSAMNQINQNYPKLSTRDLFDLWIINASCFIQECEAHNVQFIQKGDPLKLVRKLIHLSTYLIAYPYMHQRNRYKDNISNLLNYYNNRMEIRLTDKNQSIRIDDPQIIAKIAFSYHIYDDKLVLDVQIGRESYEFVRYSNYQSTLKNAKRAQDAIEKEDVKRITLHTSPLLANPRILYAIRITKINREAFMIE